MFDNWHISTELLKRKCLKECCQVSLLLSNSIFAFSSRCLLRKLNVVHFGSPSGIRTCLVATTFWVKSCCPSIPYLLMILNPGGTISKIGYARIRYIFDGTDLFKICTYWTFCFDRLNPCPKNWPWMAPRIVVKLSSLWNSCHQMQLGILVKSWDAGIPIPKEPCLSWSKRPKI